MKISSLQCRSALAVICYGRIAQLYLFFSVHRVCCLFGYICLYQRQRLFSIYFVCPFFLSVRLPVLAIEVFFSLNKCLCIALLTTRLSAICQDIYWSAHICTGLSIRLTTNWYYVSHLPQICYQFHLTNLIHWWDRPEEMRLEYHSEIVQYQ